MLKKILKKLNVVNSLKKQSKEYGMPIWKLPDFILLIMGAANITVIIGSYYWTARFAQDPREVFVLVAVEAIIIMIIGNVFAESAKHMADFNKLRKEIVYIISHQMRSPLTTIKWQVEMVKAGKKDNLTKRQLRYIDRIYRENEKLRSMISDILNMSRMEKKSDNVVLSDIVLDHEIEECMNMLRSYAETKKIEIEFKHPQEESVVRADRDKVKIPILNLIENSISYSPEGGKIKVLLRRSGDFAQVKIKDDGIGIEPSEQELIFQKFYRAENGRKKRPEGTGLGLFMTKNVVEQMKGEVKLKSKVGKGSEFSFTLPLSSSDKK